MNEKEATPHAELVKKAMDPKTQKTEREHALVKEIETLREALSGPPQVKGGQRIRGPWHVIRDGRDMLVYDADGFEVARVCYPNQYANAALIAAALDLVHALKELLLVMQRSCVDGGGPARYAAIDTLNKACTDWTS